MSGDLKTTVQGDIGIPISSPGDARVPGESASRVTVRVEDAPAAGESPAHPVRQSTLNRP